MTDIWPSPALPLKDIPSVQFISDHKPSEEFNLEGKVAGPELFSLASIASNISVPELVCDGCVDILDC